MNRPRRTMTEKAAVVGLALVKGQRAASEETGVPLTTVHDWVHRPEYEQLRTTAREDVAAQMWAAAQLGIAEMVKSLQDPRTPLRDKTDAASMLTEKYLLLRGEATTRTEHRDITDELTPEQKDALADAIDEWLRGRKAEA